MSKTQYQPKTGAACHCRPGRQRDNCPDCEGTGMRIDFRAIRSRHNANHDSPGKPAQLSLEYLQSLPTITKGHFDNLKLESADTRVWLSRMTVEDGEPYNNKVTVEQLRGGVWTEIETYQAL